MKMSPAFDVVAEISAEWREEAEQLRRRGAEHSAVLMASVADDLEARMREWWMARIDFDKIAEASVASFGPRVRLLPSGWGVGR